MCVSVLKEIVRNLLPNNYDDNSEGEQFVNQEVLPNDESAENYYEEKPKQVKKIANKSMNHPVKMITSKPRNMRYGMEVCN